jgi:endonuclease YncB( thermonuclease family)
MQSKIRRKPVHVRPSRIRREPPARMPTVAELRRAEVRAREREMWGGVAGVALFGMAIAVLTVAAGILTSFKLDQKTAAQEARFGQCYSADGGNCVVNGDTIYIGGEKVGIAGIEAPKIQGYRCEAERNRGIDAATRLADLLNGGNVTVSKSFADQSGRAVRHVLVNSQDVAGTMIDAGLARAVGSQDPDWCALSADNGDTND